jgi:hypothetical protein
MYFSLVWLVPEICICQIISSLKIMSACSEFLFNVKPVSSVRRSLATQLRLQAGRVAADCWGATRENTCPADVCGTSHRSAEASAGHSGKLHHPAWSRMTQAWGTEHLNRKLLRVGS